MARTGGRTVALLSLLQTPDRWSGPELAARLGVSLRTLRRDVDTLRELGYPVLAGGGRDSTYRLGAGHALPPLVLDGEQAVAISLALQTSQAGVHGLRDAADRALATLTRLMPAPLRAQVDATRVTTIPNYWEFAAPPIALDAVNTVGEAVRRGHLLRVELLRPDGTRPDPRDPDFVAPLRLEPHHLVLWAGRWYLVSYRPDTRAWMVHRVDRLRPQSPTGVPFVRRDPPASGVAELVMTSHERGDTPAPWPCLGVATLDVPAEVVARFAPGGSVLERLDDRRTRLTVGAWSWAGVAGLFATFDSPLTDVEPGPLRDACRELARRFAAAAEPRPAGDETG